MELSKERQATLNDIVKDLQKIQGVMAVVLGGSYASGLASDTSDIDIGIYYSKRDPFSIGDIRSMAIKYSVSETFTVTGFYEWGPWVNGGAWMQTSAGKMDFIYRNMEQVTDTIKKSKKGEWKSDFEQQPPYGFSSIIYLAEISICVALFDSQGQIAKLKRQVKIYPQKLKQAVIQQALWSAEFSIWHAEYFFSKTQDIYNVAGCLTRATKNIINALFAINEIYPLGDKRAIAILEKTQKCPPGLKEKIDKILILDKEKISGNIDLSKSLFKETVELAARYYTPFPFNLKKRDP